MTPATCALHQALIRQAKGAISAWETWLRAQSEKPEPATLQR